MPTKADVLTVNSEPPQQQYHTSVSWFYDDRIGGNLLGPLSYVTNNNALHLYSSSHLGVPSLPGSVHFARWNETKMFFFFHDNKLDQDETKSMPLTLTVMKLIRIFIRAKQDTWPVCSHVCLRLCVRVCPCVQYTVYSKCSAQCSKSHSRLSETFKRCLKTKQTNNMRLWHIHTSGHSLVNSAALGRSTDGSGTVSKIKDRKCKLDKTNRQIMYFFSFCLCGAVPDGPRPGTGLGLGSPE